jgi:hypothetical protein
MNETFTNPTSKVLMTTTKFVNIICNGPWGNPSVQIIYPRMFTFFFNGQWDIDSIHGWGTKKGEKHLKTF